MDGSETDRRDWTPLAAFAALVLLPIVLMALLAGLDTRSEVDSGGAAGPATPIEMPDLPAAADDTVVLSELASGDAQVRNAAVAFASIGPGTALPFVFRGSATDRIRARDCLALAGMAEAGSGDGDQRAVMQVILNRVRHPAFAKTVCGVVFEGSQRATGCQFSFTCDGSLARSYPDAAWAAARRRAEDMLSGAVWAPVGNSTHFHADYVYPWWSDRLDKVAAVGPHLFFRWRGFWGERAALSARYAGGEPDPLALRETAEAVAAANPLPTLIESGTAIRTIVATPTPQSSGAIDQPAGETPPGVHFVLVSAADAPGTLIDKARALCPGDRYCQVYGWSDSAAIPTSLPLTAAARQALRFSFLAARDGTREVAYFDCSIFSPDNRSSCLPRARN